MSSILLGVFAGCGDSGGDSTFDGGVEDGGASSSSSGSFPVNGDDSGDGNTNEPAVCGDGKLQAGEGCDDGNTKASDGCNATCQREPNFVCPIPGAPCAPATACGDGFVQGAEQCDDGNAAPSDGCSATCTVEPGFICPFAGAACFAAKCGDGIVAGDEECDDGAASTDSGADGCSSTCQLQEGFKCPVPNMSCLPTTCGDGIVEGTEQCDDGELKANDAGIGYLRPYDGCSTTCKKEPNCKSTAADGGITVGACTGVCGDGLVFPGEACDDGNKRNGDGCSATCTKEPGFDCSDVAQAAPPFLDLPLIIRDFRGFNDAGGNRHPDFEKSTMSPACPDTGVALGIVGGVFTTGRLDVDGKPVYLGGNGVNGNDCIRGGASGFAQWYRDTPGVNKTAIKTLRLNYNAGTDSYVFDSATDQPYVGLGGFFPIDNELFGNQGATPNHNFHFTSEVKYWFTYRAAATPPVLQFTGDDDVFVFINGILAVDIGGIHGVAPGSVTIDATNAGKLGLEDGKLYEIDVFQAERNRTASNYKLTLKGFEQKKTTCVSKCGDGIKTKNEACDDGANNDTNGPLDGGAGDGGASRPPAYGKCSFDCKSRGGYCGDGIVQSDAGETCDLGAANGGYGPESCLPGCKGPGPRCGDGKVDVLFGEECDDSNVSSGDGCSNTCKKEGGVK